MTFFNASHALCIFAVFIYSMPGYKCSIRERMLYSSCKNPLIDTVENKLQIDIAKKVKTWHAQAILKIHLGYCLFQNHFYISIVGD